MHEIIAEWRKNSCWSRHDIFWGLKALCGNRCKNDQKWSYNCHNFVRFISDTSLPPKSLIYEGYLQMSTIILDCSQVIFFTNFRFPYEMMPQGSNGSRLMKASRHRATLVQGAGMLLHTFCKVAIYKHYRTHQKTFQLASSPRPKSIH